MKKHLHLAVLLVVVTIGFSNCSKYPDGPLMSIHTRTNRLANTWKIENYKKNGTDLTSLTTSYTETFSKNGSYAYSWSLSSGSGSWRFSNSDKEVVLTGTDNQSSRVLTISRLEEDALWYSYSDNGDTYVIHLVTK